MILYDYLVVVLLTSFINKTSCQICNLLDEHNIREPRLYVEPSPSLLEGTVDEESHVTFSCEARWLSRGKQYSTRICDLAALSLETEEDLSMQLALAMEWEIDQMGPFNSTNLTPSLIERGIIISTSCEFETERLFDLLQGGSSYCRNRIRSESTTLRCTSVLNITRVAANSNVQLRCSVRPLQCSDDEFIDRSYLVQLRLQGLLGPPPGLRVDKLNSTTVFLSWNPPSTLSGIPISQYTVAINNLVSVSTVNVTATNQPSINQNMTSLDLSSIGTIGYLYDPGCESLQFSVSAWNSVGEGTNNTVLYSQESLQNVKVYTALHNPDVVCVLCGFSTTSEARGCQATLQKEMNGNLNNITMFTTTVFNLVASKTDAVIEAFDCFPGLTAGNYTVKVQEIECTGGIGLRQFIHNHVSINGMDDLSEESTYTPTSNILAQGSSSDTQTISFSVTVSILVIVLLLMIVLVILLIVGKSKNSKKVTLKGIRNQTPPATLPHHTSPQSSTDEQIKCDSNHDQDFIYDNDFDVTPTNAVPTTPSTEYSYTTVTYSGKRRPKVDTNNSIKLESCIAYGKTA